LSAAFADDAAITPLADFLICRRFRQPLRDAAALFTPADIGRLRLLMLPLLMPAICHYAMRCR